MKLIIACRCPKVLLLRFFNAIFVPLESVNLLPKCRKWHFRDYRFKNFPGGMPPNPPRSTPAYGRRGLYITQITGKN